jgi:hypothetical protein
VDRAGNYEKVIEDCLQVTAKPDRDNIWTCTSCGAQAKFIDRETFERQVQLAAATAFQKKDQAPEEPAGNIHPELCKKRSKPHSKTE